MRIVFDHQIFSQQRYGGISRYFCEVADRLSQYPDCDVNVLAPAHVNEHLAHGVNPTIVVGTKLPDNPHLYRSRYRGNELLSWFWLQSHRPDIVHETYYSRRRGAPKQAKIVLTVLDMIHEKLPKYFPPSDRSADIKAQAVARADHVICISENTRNDLLNIVNVDPGRVSVVHLGHSLRTAQAGALPHSVGDVPYLLFVGQRGGYKNFAGMLQAVASSFLLKQIRIIAFGGGAFTADEQMQIRELGLAPDMVQQQSGSDDTLSGLYAGAAALVYPSLYEGFGIPPLEAMAHECPVACSDTSSLPEVVGDAAELFNPHDPESIMAALERLLVSSDRAMELRRRGRDRVTLFSWGKCAASTRSVYQRVLDT